MRRCAIALAVIAGCGFEGRNTRFDMPVDATEIDSIDADDSCMGRWFSGALTWQPEVALGISGTDPFLTPDELTLYFSVNLVDVYVARRSAIGEAFTGAALASEFSTAAGESRVWFSGDGMIAVLASDRVVPTTKGMTDVFYGTRSSGVSTFTWDQTRVELVNTAGNQWDPMISVDGLRLYLAPNDTGAQRIHVAQRGAITEPFEAPTMIAELVGGDYENDPAVSTDERVIVFNRHVNGELLQHIWYAVRTDPQAQFGTPALVPGVNTIDQNDQDPVLSPDGCRIYYTRGSQLYVRDMAPR